MVECSEDIFVVRIAVERKDEKEMGVEEFVLDDGGVRGGGRGKGLNEFCLALPHHPIEIFGQHLRGFVSARLEARGKPVREGVRKVRRLSECRFEYLVCARFEFEEGWNHGFFRRGLDDRGDVILRKGNKIQEM